MLLRQLLDRATKLGGDRSICRFVGRRRRVVPRRSDDQSHLSRSRNAFPFRPGPVRAIEVTGKHCYVPSGDERTNPRFEFLKLARHRPRAFRENDKDVAGIREQLAADREAVANMSLARKRERIHNHRRDPGPRHTLKKVIGSRCWKSAMQTAQW